MDILIVGAVVIAAAVAFMLVNNRLRAARNRLQPIPPGDPRNPQPWDLLTISRGEQKSKGFDKHPVAHPDGLLIRFDAGDDLRYASFNPGPGALRGAKLIRMRGRFDFADGARLYPSADAPDSSAPTLLTLFMQRVGDDWLAKGKSENDRQWATFATLTVHPGEFVVEAPLSGRWTGTDVSNAHDDPAGFRDTAENCGRLGFTLGGGFSERAGYGHGATATGQVDLIIRSFDIE